MTEEKNELYQAIKDGFLSMSRATKNYTLPIWNSDLATNPIQDHLADLESMSQLLGWSDEEKLTNLLLSLKGSVKTTVTSLPKEEKTTFEDVKEALTNLYAQEKAQSQLLLEVSTIEFNPPEQNINEFINSTVRKYAKIGIRKDTPSDVVIRSSIVKSLKKVEPKFGFFVEMNQDRTGLFNDWAAWLTEKWQNFQYSSQDQEDVMFFTGKQDDKRRWANSGGRGNGWGKGESRGRWPEPGAVRPGAVTP